MSYYVSHGRRRQRRARMIGLTLAAALGLGAGMAAADVLGTSVSDAAPSVHAQPSASAQPPSSAQPSASAPAVVGAPRAASGGGAGTADLGNGPITTPGSPGELNPQLYQRFLAAQRAAEQEAGITLKINSGARTVDEQDDMIKEVFQEHGGAQEGRKFVAPADKSAHVQGLAIDVGPPEGAAWLEKNETRFGLCRIYANETWHFEPVIGLGGTCPALLPSAESLW